MIYTASQLLPGATGIIREHSFTRWMSRDLLQATTDFCRNLGLVALYSESSPNHQFRYLFWHPPPGANFEIRSGRTKEQFIQLDTANIGVDRSLVSLHISEAGIYSATWISSEHHEKAKAMLSFYGITSARRESAID